MFGRRFSLHRPSALAAKPVYASVVRARASFRRLESLERMRRRAMGQDAPGGEYDPDSAVPDEALEEAIALAEERLGDLALTLGVEPEPYHEAVTLLCAHWADPPEEAQADPVAWYLAEYTIAQGMTVISSWFIAQELSAAQGKS